MKNRFILIGGIFIVLVIGALLFFFNKNNIEDSTNKQGVVFFSIEPEEAAPLRLVNSNNELLGTFSSSKFSVSFPIGEQSFSILSSSHKNISGTVTVKPNETASYSATMELNVSEARDTISQTLTGNKDLFNLENGYWVKNPQFYLDNTWLTGIIVTTERATDGELVVLKNESGNWNTVYAGTAMRRSVLQNNGVPEEVITGLGL